MSETESMSERELAEWISEEVFSGKTVEEQEKPGPTPEEQPEEQPPVVPTEEEPVVVEDEPKQPEAPAPEAIEELPQEPAEEPELDEEADPNVIWAKRKYGDDPSKWAKAAYEQEQHISRQAGKIKEAEDLAAQWYEYAQSVEQQQPQMQMPLSSQEEAWAEQAMANPVQYAAQAAMQGNIQLYNAIIERVAYQDPRQASAVETEVRLQLIAAAEAEQAENGQQLPLQESLAVAVQRAGIDIPTYGQAMMEKIEELGEMHPYVQTILEGDDQAREIALMAVLDMVRSTSLTTRRVRDTARDDQIKREAELRKQAAGVVTGGGNPNPPEKTSPFMEAMEAEWRQRGQWSSEE